MGGRRPPPGLGACAASHATHAGLLQYFGLASGSRRSTSALSASAPGLGSDLGHALRSCMVLGRARPDERRRRRRLRLLRITPQALKAPTWESLGCSFFYLLPRPRAPPRGRHHPPGLPGGTAGSTWSAALASPSRNSPPPYIWSRGPSRKKKSWAGGACQLLNQNLGRVLPKFGSKSGAKVKSGAVKTGPYTIRAVECRKSDAVVNAKLIPLSAW